MHVYFLIKSRHLNTQTHSLINGPMLDFYNIWAPISDIQQCSSNTLMGSTVSFSHTTSALHINHVDYSDCGISDQALQEYKHILSFSLGNRNILEFDWAGCGELYLSNTLNCAAGSAFSCGARN